MTQSLTNLERMCIHTMTNKPWTLRECIDGYTAAGVPAITVWRQVVDAVGTKQAAAMLKDSGLRITSLCRGGFFPAGSAEKRQAAIDDNKVMIDMAAEIGAPLIVLVCGAEPGQPLTESRKQITDGIAAVLPHAEAAGVKLGIEPLHPMYADDRSAVNTMGQANDMVEALGHANIGVAVDVYHLWWDPALESEIRRCGEKIFAFHVCDWRTPTRDLLTDRGLMGEGCIDIRGIRGWVEGTGFAGDIEVEIFSEEFWAMEQADYLEKIKSAYLEHV